MGPRLSSRTSCERLGESRAQVSDDRLRGAMQKCSVRYPSLLVVVLSTSELGTHGDARIPREVAKTTGCILNHGQPPSSIQTVSGSLPQPISGNDRTK